MNQNRTLQQQSSSTHTQIVEGSNAGTVLTVTPAGAATVEAARFAPAALMLDEIVAERKAALSRPTKPGRSAIGAFFWRLGQRVKRFFQYNVEGKTPRAWELDVLRGVVMLFVTLDHCMFFGQKEAILPVQTSFGLALRDFAALYCASATRHVMQPFGLWFIALLSGLNCAFTRSRAWRVVKFWCFTAIFMGIYALLHVVWPELVTATFIFNIIHVLTICFTVWWLLDLIKTPYWVRGYLGAALIIVGLSYFYMHYIQQSSYVQNDFLALMVYNTHGYELAPQNFEPLLPHLGFFLVGGVLGKFLYPDRKTKCKTIYPPKALYPLLMMGKHSLVIYFALPFVLLGIVRGIVALVALFV